MPIMVFLKGKLLLENKIFDKKMRAELTFGVDKEKFIAADSSL